ncbi:MAG: glycosyltransferase family 4 protein [Patescibacteria group bacterium]
MFYELDGGGARRTANEFARALRKFGHTVELFVVDSSKRLDLERFFNAVHLYQFTPVVWTGKNWIARLYRDTVELYQLNTLHKKIARNIHHGSFDFAFVHPSRFTQAPFLLRHLKIPTVYYCQEPLRMVYESIFAIPADLHPIKKAYEYCIRKIRKVIDRKNLSSADTILTNSRYTKRNIERAYGLKSTVCHVGVDTTTFYQSAKKSIDVLFMGTKDPLEGYPLFQNALEIMKTKPTTIELIRGESRAINDDQLRDYYSSARTVLCLGYNEPFGLIPLEAMACGAVPVVLSEGGYLESVKDGITGVLVKKNPKDLALTLEKLLGNTEKLERMSVSAIQDVRENWQWSAGAQQIIQTYKTLH